MVGFGGFTGPFAVVMSSAVAVAAGAMHTCAAWSGGFSCWGNNSFGQLGTADTMERLSPTSTSVSGGAKTNGSFA